MGAPHLALRSKRALACLAVGLLTPLAVVVPTSPALAAPEQDCVTSTAVAVGSLDRSIISGDGSTIAAEGHSPDSITVVNRATGQVRFTLVSPTGSTPLALDDNGEFLVFHSNRSDLVPGDTNNAGDVFVVTLATGVIERVTVATGGGQGTFTDATHSQEAPISAGISADGRYVVFSTYLDNLMYIEADHGEDVFIRDRVAGTTTSPETPYGKDANDIRISDDGRTLTYFSWAENDTAMRWATFVDRTSVTLGMPLRGYMRPLAGGRAAVYSIDQLSPADTDFGWDAFTVDMAHATWTLLTASYGTGDGLAGVSQDGRWWLLDQLVFDAVNNTIYRPITMDGRTYAAMALSTNGQWIVGSDASTKSVVVTNSRAPSATTFEPLPVVGANVASHTDGDLRGGDAISAGPGVRFGAPTLEPSGNGRASINIAVDAGTVPGPRTIHVDRPGICSRDLDLPTTLRSDLPRLDGEITYGVTPGLSNTYSVSTQNVTPGAVFSAGQGITVTATYVLNDRADISITVAADAQPGPRSLTVTNPSGATYTLAYWTDVYPSDYYGVPTPTIDLMLSNVVHPGEETPVLLVGTGFLPWTWLRVAPQLELLRTQVIDSEHIFAVVRSHATGDDLGEISATNGRVRTSMPYAGITTRTGEGEFHPITPTRFLDTREPAPHPMHPASTIDVHVTGRDGVPSTGVAAVVMNVTAVDATKATYLTVYPSGQSQPDASSVNVASTDAVPNLVTAKVGRDGNVSIFNYDGDVNVVVDVVGWYSANGAVSAVGPGAAYFPLSPERILDTRNSIGGRNGQGLGAGETMRLKIAEPDDGVTAAALNVTIASPSEGTFLSVWPSDKPLPRASNLNARKGQSIPNMVLTPVAPDGTISIYNYAGTAHVVVDLLGFYDDGSVPTLHGVLRSVAPTRILDTRKGLGAPKVPVDANKTLDVRIYGSAGVPWGATAVVLNVTGTEATAGTFLTVFPSDEDRPNASNINLDRGGTAPNMVVVPIALDGTISIYNYAGSTHVIADVVGYYT